MAPLPVINRGFGGSHLDHAVHYAHRIIFPYSPRAIVLYAGENDLAWPSRKTPQQVFGDFERLVTLVQEKQPGTPVYFLSIKRSLLRRSRWRAMEEANRLVHEFARSNERVRFIDVNTPMLDPNGDPRPEFLPWYRIHMTARGYELWASIVRPALERA